MVENVKRNLKITALGTFFELITVGNTGSWKNLCKAEVTFNFQITFARVHIILNYYGMVVELCGS